MNIYIGNLSYRVRESDLQQVLEEYGVVDSVKLIVDRDTRRSKGFAFAEMPNVDEAQKAIEELNHLTTFVLSLVQLLDSFLSLCSVRHLSESEALRTFCVTVNNDFN